ncbi:MAG: ABC transporter permease [Candidatus Thorarchaeota archaeon]|nr:MAG: ABC transporter permease [Candidatus Thorarchaeota archaeon]
MFLFARLSSQAPVVLTTLIIFALSSGVLGGILFYMDSTAPDVLDDMTANVPIDMEIAFTTPFYSQNNITINDIEESVAQQDYVIATEQVKFAQVHDYSGGGVQDTRKGFLGINITSFDSFPDAIDIEIFNQDYDDNSCMLENSLFLREGYRIGDNYTIDLLVYNSTWDEVEIHKTFTIVGTFSSNIYMYTPVWGQPEVTYLNLITTPDAISATFDVLGYDSYYGLQEKIWVQFDHTLIVQSDSSSVVYALSNIERRIEQDNLPYALVDDFQLIGAVYEFSSWSISMRAIALSFSIPSVIMGAMLIQYNARLLSDAQRKDVGTLKTRGASGWQAFNWVLSNALATGFIGSLGAIATGIASALLSGTVRELLVFDPQRLAGFEILLQPYAVTIVFLFSFLVGLIVALPSAVKALLMTPTEAHSNLQSDILVDAEKMGSPTIDLIAVGASGWLLVPLITSLAYSSYDLFSSITFAAIIIPVLGIFLFSFTRLLSRPTAAIKAKVLGRIKRPSLIVGSRLMSRTVLMFKKSETMGTMFIAMVFTAGLFSAVSATTGNYHMRELFMFQTGADVTVDINPAFTNITMDLVANISAVEGVAHVSPMYRTTGYIQYWNAYYFGSGQNYNRTITIFGVEPESWIESAFWLNYFTYYNLPQTSIPLLAQPNDNGINIISSFKPVFTYTVDSLGGRYPQFSDTLNLHIISEASRNVTECKIVDLMTSTLSDQQSGLTFVPGEPQVNDFLVVDIDYVHMNMNNTRVTKFYIDLEPGTNYTQAMLDISAIAPYSFNDIESPYTSIDNVLDSRATQSIYGTYTLNVIFSLVYLTIGMIIVSIVRVRGLRKQFSVIRALGAPNRSIIAASLTETSLGILIAAGIGGTIGVTLALLLVNIPLLHMGVSTLGLWNRLPVQLALPLPLISVIVGVAVAASLIATYLVLERTLKLNIAEEIQYNE